MILVQLEDFSVNFFRGNGFYSSIVIDLSIAMERTFIILMLILVSGSYPVNAQQEAEFTISSPTDGQIVQGQVSISGTVSALGFSSYEMSFAYQNDPTLTWFILAKSTQPIFEGELGTWDTTTLTDGDYVLRVQVFLLDGTLQEKTVSGIRIRNYTAVPTATFTPTPTAVVLFAPPTAQLMAPEPATATPVLPSPTPLPPNPASLHETSIPFALGRGAILTLLLFVGFGLLLRMRRDG